jgi:hypothetical protein
VNKFRTASCAAAFFALAAASGVNAQDPTCSKNHYILTGSATPWIATGSLNVPRSRHSATLLPDGKVLVAGGRSSNPPGALESAELYDPATGSWTATANLTTPRVGHGAALLPNGKVLVVGGDSGGLTAELYDPASGTWTATGSLNTPRFGFSATPLDNGKVLVVGGVGMSDETLFSTELYDPATGTWSYTGDVLRGRFFHTATLLEDGRVLIVGGWGDDISQLSMTTAELYDPVTGTWSAAAGLSQARSFHTATRLVDGTVLISGGYRTNLVHYPGVPGTFHVPTSLDEAELFDPIAGTWEIVGNLNGARDSHTATLLLDGKVLVAGGFDYTTYTYPTGTDSYDPVTATWAGVGGFDSGRYQNTATLLSDGTVLVVGGQAAGPDGEITLATAELYQGGGSDGCQ